MARETPSVHDPAGGGPSSFNGITLDAVDVSAPTPSVGASESFTAALIPGYAPSRDGLTEPRSPMDRYRELEAYSLHAGEFETIPLDDGRLQFVDETPAGWEYDILVRLETPPTSTAASRYGLLERVGHGPMAKEGGVQIEFDLLYLAPLSEYETKTALRQDLEAPGF